MFALLLVACTGEKSTEETPTTTPTPVPTQDPGPTPVDTGIEEPPFMTVGILTFAAQFGFDAGTGTAQAIQIDGNAIAPTFDIYLGVPSWTGDLGASDSYCTISYDVSGLPVAVQADGQWVSIDVPADAPTASDCELDPEEWGEDAAETFRPATFSMSVGPLAQEVREWLEPQLQPGQIDLFHGGLVLAPDLIADPITFVYSTVYEADESLAAVLDETDALVALDRPAIESAPPTAWYTINVGVLWTIE